MTYLKVELPRTFRAHSRVQISPAETIHISRITRNAKSEKHGSNDGAKKMMQLTEDNGEDDD